MENSKMKPFTGQVGLLLKNDRDFPQKLKQRLVLEPNNVKNPYKFIAGLFTECVLSDGSSEPEASFGLKEIMVQLAITIACSKGADAIGGLMKALEGSGNSQLISALRTWAKLEFGIDIDGELSEPKEGAAVPSVANGKLGKNVTIPTESSSSGTKLIDKITSRMEDDFMEELGGHLVCKVSEVVNPTQFCKSLVHLDVLEEIDIQLPTGPQVHKVQLTEKGIKAACSKKAMGSLVLALQTSSNERILAETCTWLETSPARKNNYPISIKSLARQRRPTATGIFAATASGLISLDLRTLESTALTSVWTRAVAVNHNLRKVYWSEVCGNHRIMRSNFDGSAKEIIVQQTGESISALAIDEPSGKVYFARCYSHEIKVCNALGKNCAVVISNSSLVNSPVSITLDCEKGFLYWGNRGIIGTNSLVRANLDGSNATIISTGFNNLQSIALDQATNDVLYWVDGSANTIGTVDVIRGNKRTIAELERDSALWGIQVDAHKVYVSSILGKNIQSVDRDSGKELTTAFKSKGHVHHLALFNALVTF